MSTSYMGIPIKDRSKADICAALQGQEAEIVERFVALHAWARDRGMGLSALANASRINSSILSECFNGTYRGDYAAIGERIRVFFWREEQKALYGGLREFVETRLAKSLWAVFEKCRIIRRFQIVEGPEQVGKTRAAVEYAERNNSGRTVYAKLAGGTRSGCGDFIWDLAEVLGIPHSIKMREKRLRIRQTLTSCDLVIVDEAHLVYTWTAASQAEFWDYLRTDVHDDGARGVVLLATNCKMLKRLQEWRRASGYNIGQLLGRMRQDVVQIDPTEDITEEDVRALAERYYRPGAAVIRKLVWYATRERMGHYGALLDVLNEAWTKAKARRRQMDDETVVSVLEDAVKTAEGRKEIYE